MHVLFSVMERKKITELIESQYLKDCRGADVAKWIKAVDCESTMRGFNSRRSPQTKEKDFFLVNVSQLTPISFL